MAKAEESREERTRRHVRKSTARHRNAYVRLRKLTSLPTFIRWRQAAHNLPGRAFTIPREQGFLVLPPGRFPEVDEVVLAANTTAAAADMDARIEASHKPFLASLLNQPDLTLDSTFMRLALRPDLVSAVAGYLGVLPIPGPPGTICGVDTSRRFHYGSRVAAPTGRRVVVLMQYITPWAFILPPNFTQAARFRRLGATTSDPTTRAVLGAA